VEFGIESRRVAIEAIANLVHIKRAMAELILKPAGVPEEVYEPLLNKRDSETGRPLSKRQIAPLILDAVDRRPECAGVVRAILEIAANWSSYHLADDEHDARATVLKAREVLGMVELMEQKEAQQPELFRKDEIARMERERAALFRRQSELLLLMFDDLAKSDDPQRRGYLLEELLNRLFDLHGIPVYTAFRRNGGGEQIDGAFKLDGWYYVVECRWRHALADAADLDALVAKVSRSGHQTMGLFLCINGWSEHVVPILKQNSEKRVLLMEGAGLRSCLSGEVDLSDFIGAMAAHLNLKAEPFLPAAEYFTQSRSTG
jgi:hypothetical protein